MDWRNWEGSSMAGSDHILIVGGGIAGLSAAAALRQKGFDPELVEREPKWSALGAGIAIQPNGTRVLQSLGVFAEIEEAGAPLHRFVFCTPQGETLAAIDLQELWKDVGRGIGIERGKLETSLLSAVDGLPCRLGVSVTSLKQDGRRVAVTFTDGGVGEYDLVIGADGISSTVRHLALSEAAPTYAGQMAWRGLAPRDPDDAGEIRFWMGDECFFGSIRSASGAGIFSVMSTRRNAATIPRKGGSGDFASVSRRLARRFVKVSPASTRTRRSIAALLSGWSSNAGERAALCSSATPRMRVRQ
jgi:2-polyprenyl-6-methoxyphenol hydroxylase-like FAD-dependent oxidoreductase